MAGLILSIGRRMKVSVLLGKIPNEQVRLALSSFPITNTYVFAGIFYCEHSKQFWITNYLESMGNISFKHGVNKINDCVVSLWLFKRSLVDNEQYDMMNLVFLGKFSQLVQRSKEGYGVVNSTTGENVQKRREWQLDIYLINESVFGSLLLLFTLAVGSSIFPIFNLETRQARGSVLKKRAGYKTDSMFVSPDLLFFGLLLPALYDQVCWTNTSWKERMGSRITILFFSSRRSSR